jgi:hypothetical protein
VTRLWSKCPQPSAFFRIRLLDVHTYALHEFIGTDIPHYAILSHCWESDEVTFRALKAGEASKMKGWIKIKGCCEQAIEEGLNYAVSSFKFLLAS